MPKSESRKKDDLQFHTTPVNSRKGIKAKRVFLFIPFKMLRFFP